MTQLGQRPVIINTHPLVEHRIATAENNYPQIPVREKRGGPNWPRQANDVEAIRREKIWRDTYYTGTGIRLEGDLCAIDIDVTIQRVVDRMHDVLYDLDPDAHDNAIHRDSGGASTASFMRCREPFTRRATRKYTAHPEVLEELLIAYRLPEEIEADRIEKDELIRDLLIRLEPQFVEIWGPAAQARQFQVDGQHSPGRDFHCWGNAPWNWPRENLSYLPLGPGELCDRLEQVLIDEGLTLIPETESPAAAVQYSLTPETMFYPKDGEPDQIQNLTVGMDYGAEHGIYGCLPETRHSKSRANCKLFVSVAGHVVVSDWSHDGAQYRMKEDEPAAVELDEQTIEVLKALQQDSEAAAPEPEMQEFVREPLEDIVRGDEKTTYVNAAMWMIRNVAFYAHAFKGHGGAVSIHPNGELRTPITITSLRGLMMKYSYMETGPRGGQRRRHPVDAWAGEQAQIHIDGIRLRPELPRPLYREEGLLFVNRYLPPVHAQTGGSIHDFEAFMARLIPNPVERRWFWNWLASKVQHPEWRMVGVAMVAREMGTGRGFLAETLMYLFGERFITPLPYAKLSGGSGARFNAEVVDKLLVYINESRDAEDHKFAHKNAAREALKDFVEPNHRLPFRVEPKGLDAYNTYAAISTLIFTNNLDGLPISEKDRRIAVIMNGAQMSMDERDRHQAWMLDPANIGALWRALASHKVEQNTDVFNPYMAPPFRGRDLVIDAGKTELDRAWEQAIEKIGSASDLYTMSQIVSLTRHYAKTHNSDFDALVRKHTIVNGHRIGTKHSTNWLIRYGSGEDNRERVYALDDVGQIRYSGATPGDIKAQLDKTQAVVEAPSKAFNKLMRGVKND